MGQRALVAARSPGPLWGCSTRRVPAPSAWSSQHLSRGQPQWWHHSSRGRDASVMASGHADPMALVTCSFLVSVPACPEGVPACSADRRQWLRASCTFCRRKGFGLRHDEKQWRYQLQGAGADPGAVYTYLGWSAGLAGLFVYLCCIRGVCLALGECCMLPGFHVAQSLGIASHRSAGRSACCSQRAGSMLLRRRCGLAPCAASPCKPPI